MNRKRKSFALQFALQFALAALFISCFVPVSSVFAFQEDGSTPIEFAKDIRPLLADYCFGCHGPDAAKREGGFRLDVRESAMSSADSGETPIIPGDATGSELLRRMMSDDESEKMPPVEAEKHPSKAQIDLIKRWIVAGAKWEEHWAFAAPRETPIPKVDAASNVRNPIDAFVLARLQSQHRTLLPEAARETLARRVYLDLIGLPPSTEEVDEFLADESADAYEKLVDRLLASPHYGEHMATMWLDGARFADTNGYQNDFRRSMWLWRDWVIRAYNANMSFDQFTIEQIAGDLLPNPTIDQKVATGFNRNHRMNTEGGSIDEEWLVENVVDRVETTSTVFLGLTVGCARCHDHKYDPISQQEFYEFFAFFNNVDEKGVYLETRGNVEPKIAVETPEFRRQLLALDEKIATAKTELDQLAEESQAREMAWRAELVKQEIVQPPVPAIGLFSRTRNKNSELHSSLLEKANATHPLQDDLFGSAISIPKGQHLDLGKAFDFAGDQSFSLTVWAKPSENGAILSRMDSQAAYRGFDLLIMPDGRMNVHLIHDWPNNAIKVTTRKAILRDKWNHVAAIYDGSGKASGLQVFINANPVELEVNNDNLNGSTLTDHPLWVGLRGMTPPFVGKVSDLRIFDEQISPAEVDHIFNENLQFVASALMAKEDVERADLLKMIFQTSIDKTFSDAFAAVQALENQRKELQQKLPTTMVMRELAEPRMTYVLNRGQYDQPDKARPVSPNVPDFLPPMAADLPRNRLGLARWLVDSGNPLTARVAVNRYWKRYFGVGLMETQENFGVQSPPPTHPELLDWLATEFVRSGWDIKAMQKLMVTSNTYRQTSEASAEQYLEDPSNRWLGRGPRFRLPAESIRDNALAISGLLTRKIGGPSIKPYQPEGLWEELAGGAKEPPYVQASDEDLYRRSLYIYRKRTVPHPTMTTFDGTSREICTVARSRTNTPLQALALLNDLTYVEAARQLAMLAIENNVDRDAQIRYAFRRATLRWPNQEEGAVLLAAFERYRNKFNKEPEKAVEFISNGLKKVDPKFDPVKLAAMTAVASVILNLDEVISKE